MTQQRTPTGNTASFVKISGKIGAGHDSPLIKIYNDYENTHVANRETKLNLEPHEIESILAKDEVKEKLADDDKFKKYLSLVIKNSLTKTKQTCDSNYTSLKNNLTQLKAVTDSTHLSDLLKTVLSAI